MATYAVSFHLKKDSSYETRYGSLMEEIRKSSTVWDETTSFCLVERSESLSVFTSKLYMTDFSPSRDKLLVMSVKEVAASARGDINYPATLRSLLPSIDIG